MCASVKGGIWSTMSVRIRRLLILLFSGLFFLGLPGQAKTETYVGLYVTDCQDIQLFRTIEIINSGIDELWWFNAPEAIHKQILEASKLKKCPPGITADMGINRFLLTIKGELSKPGKFGLDGQYDREVTLSEVISIEKICANDGRFQ